MKSPYPSKEEITIYQSAIRQINSNSKKAIIILKKLHNKHPLWLEPLIAIAEQALNPDCSVSRKEKVDLLKKVERLSKSQDPRILFLISRIHTFNGNLEEGIAALEDLRAKYPNFHYATQELACQLLRKESWKAAENILREQLNIYPNSAHLKINLAVALMRQNHLDEALLLAKEAVEMAALNQKAAAHVNLGTILQELGNREEAEMHYKKTLNINPDHINARLNLGVIALQSKNLEIAEKYFRDVLERNKEDCRTAVNLAGVLLLQDQAEEGWKFYEKRVDENTSIMEKPEKLKIWRGGQLTGPLILQHEQGLGDTFQFIRYANLLKNKGISCYFRGPQKLHSIVQRSKLVKDCLSLTDQIPPEAEAWIAMMSLPALFGASVRKPIATTSPYIQVDQTRVSYWAGKLGKRNGLRIALHWQGNPDHEFTISRGRSFPLRSLEPLLKLKDIEWISLQKGPGSDQFNQSGFSYCSHSVQKEIDNAWSFDDAAAILQCCDGLVSSDSGLAHLAGACGIPTWLLLPWLAEWRWDIEGKSTAWYPNHVLLRQQHEGDWGGPVNNLTHLLREA